jgi:hypothetical protein
MTPVNESLPSVNESPGAAPPPGTPVDDAQVETYNPWTVVNLVFGHLAEQGLHPVLGDRGDPAEPARALLTALGIQPAAEGNREVMRRVREHLAEIRTVVMEGDPAVTEE